MGLNHAVITSVDRDDLADGGAKHFVEMLSHPRGLAPHTTLKS